MQPDTRRRLGRSSVEVTQFGLGGAAFGNIHSVVSEPSVAGAIEAAYAAGVRYFDTAPLYGHGRSEVRLGAGLARYDRDEVVISTKVGYALEPRTPDRMPKSAFVDPLPFEPVFNYSRDAILRSFEESLRRLKTDRVDILLIHDPDEGVTLQPGVDPYAKSHFREVMAQAYPALDELRAQGVVRAIGLGMNQWQMLCDFAVAGNFDCFLLAGRYTLLEQASLHQLLPLCEEKQISIILGGPYNSGILATGAVANAYYNYAQATPEILERTRRIEAVCARHRVALQAAALQFPFGHPTVASVIPGARSAAELQANIGFFEQEIPADFWAELKSQSLVDPSAPTP
ncbi:MAG: aldo/keto reductase [Candidatus Latescibacteria bacterium]|nr:aldo/keto reductase [Candidatus Latescibacterota bacterium]